MNLAKPLPAEAAADVERILEGRLPAWREDDPAEFEPPTVSAADLAEIEATAERLGLKLGKTALEQQLERHGLK